MTEEQEPHGVEPVRVLVVDDDRLTLRAVRSVLSDAGREVATASNGIDAWEYVREQRPRLVITDWEMAGMDGRELVTRIRAAEFPTYTYIILLTGRSDPADIVAGLDSGADDYLTKPFDPSEMLSRVAIGERILRLEDALLRKHEELSELASRDALTGLLNRRAMTDRALVELHRCEREGGSLSIALVDVDHFKRVNDTHGHQAGDAVLCEVASSLGAGVRSYDWIGRWGGEEFLLVLPGTTSAEGVLLAERLRTAVAEDSAGVLGGPVTVSIGVATREPSDATALGELIECADQAMYAAKKAGRNCVKAFPLLRKAA